LYVNEQQLNKIAKKQLKNKKEKKPISNRLL
jgi:hypothetical protein